MKLKILFILLLSSLTVAGQITEDDHDTPDAHHDDHAGHADEVKLTASAIERLGIKTDKVQKREIVPTFSAAARVTLNSEAMAHVGSALRGRIVELKAKLGDVVKKGDVLVSIDSPELAEAQSDLLLKRAEAEIAETAIEPAKSAFERAEGLFKKNEGIAKSEVDRRAAELKSVQSRAAIAKSSATAAENRAKMLGMNRTAIDVLIKTNELAPRLTIEAPIDGTVIEREVTLGELVGPDRDSLLVLADLSTLWVIAEVPEGRLADIKNGTQARIELAARPGEFVSGQVSHIASTLNSATRTASVRIDVPNNGDLRAGMFARAEIQVAGAKSTTALAVPESAILLVEGSQAVFIPVKGEPNTFAKRAIKTGKSAGGWVPVLDGLEEGDAVVTAGAFYLKADLGKSGAGHAH